MNGCQFEKPRDSRLEFRISKTLADSRGLTREPATAPLSLVDSWLRTMSNKPEQASTIGDPGGLGVLDDLAKAFVSRAKRTKVMLRDGSVLTRVLRAQYRKHRMELVSNQELMLIDVEANYGQFTLLVVKPAAQQGSRSSRKIVTASGRPYEISAVALTELSRAQSGLIASGAVAHILESVSLRDGEEIDISQRLVRMFLLGPTRERVMAFIDAVIDFMPHEPGGKDQFGFEGLPDSLQPLIPLLAKWAISDDDERSRKLRRCTRSTRQRLVTGVVPFLPDIDKYLGSFGENPTEEACAFGDLAQAALEAQSLIAEQSPT